MTQVHVQQGHVLELQWDSQWSTRVTQVHVQQGHVLELQWDSQWSTRVTQVHSHVYNLCTYSNYVLSSATGMGAFNNHAGGVEIPVVQHLCITCTAVYD